MFCLESVKYKYIGRYKVFIGENKTQEKLNIILMSSETDIS